MLLQKKPRPLDRVANLFSEGNNAVNGPSLKQVLKQKRQLGARYFIDYPLSMIASHGDFIRMPDIDITHFVMNPRIIAEILKDKQTKYSKDNSSYRFMHYIFGQSVLTTEGDFWIKNKKALQPAFTQRMLPSYAQLLEHNTDKLAQHWLQYSQSQQIFDAALEISYITLLNSVLIQLDTDFSKHTIGFVKHVNFLNEYLFQFSNPYKPSIRAMRYHLSKHRIHQMLRSAMASAQRSERDTIFSRLLDQTALPQAYKTPRALLNNIKTMIIAGYETTATLLTWACYNLATHPRIQTQLRTEIMSSFGQNMPSQNELHALPFLDAVLNETLRLYPPIWNTNRIALSTDTIAGFNIPQHSMMILHYYGLHRNPLIWEDANHFKPERFLPENKSNIEKYAFLPFGTGPHQCIAKQFAMLEAKMIIARLLQTVSLTYAGKNPPQVMPLVTLQADRPVLLRAQAIS